MSGPTRIIAGESYSPNLGDGIIADSLAFLFQQETPLVNNRFLDISLRPRWGVDDGVATENGRLKTKLQSLRQILGNRTYNQLIWRTMKHNRSRKAWDPIIQDATSLIIGGGLLLMDNDLDFPLKINTLVKLAEARSIPIHFSACGVGHNRPWSKKGLQLIRAALTAADSITLRDKLSQQKLHELMPQLNTAVTFDPAIWAQDVYGPPSNPTATPLIGLGIIQVHKINEYNRNASALNENDMLAFWLKIIGLLRQQGLDVELFSNGSKADAVFAKEIAKAAKIQKQLNIPVAPSPQQPQQLVHTINRYSGAIVFRLHASIIATAYRIPTVGLVWDQKVRAFYEETQRQAYCFDIFSSQPETIIAALKKSLADDISEAALAQWKAKARETVSLPLLKDQMAIS